MAIKKSELYSSLWKSCDELRGGMDASQYKDYVLVLLFIKYVSDKYAGQPRSLIEVPKGSSFADMVLLKGDKEIGDKINKQIIAKIAEANNLKGIIDVADFNDADKLGKGKEMQDRLSNLVSIFDTPALDFRRNRAEGDDLLGDAYEYLMRHFATESGKSKGQFYTPSEVSRVMAKVIGINKAQGRSETIYDPTCGSGSLLLKAADEATNGITIYGQEMDNATYALACMNMILHGHEAYDIWHDNSLSRPYFKQDIKNDPSDHNLKTFDFAVANPPFSNKAWSNGFDPEHDLYQRFALGVPPLKNGDYAFLLHIICSLKSTGKGAVILPHGVLFRGNSEAEIRQKIIRRGYIKGIIGLPPNLFYGTGIPACIIVLDKENATSRTGIFMIDASKGFMKDGNKNRLRHQDIHKIVDAFTRQLELPRYSRMVSISEIEANDYNLNIPRYIDSTEPEDLHDITAHLLGGIPEHDIEALSDYWQVFPTLKQRLFASGPRASYSELCVDSSQIKPTIFSHPEFVAYTQTVTSLFEQWKACNTPALKQLGVGSRPKALIEQLSEDILRVFAVAQLIDKYDVYQHLMSYWSDVMQDDVYMIAQDGWQANEDLIPRQLIVKRYFAAEQQHIEQLEAAKDEITRRLEELKEEHSGEDGLLEEAKTEKGTITKNSINARLRDIMTDPEAMDERMMLNTCLDLINQEAEASKKVRTAQKALDAKVDAKYKVLSEDEIKTLVVDDKWLASLSADVQTELNRVSQALTGRIKELAERYETPLPKLSEEVEVLSEKVHQHLQRMGFAWS
ncbi:type I restriction-modification system subunit M [Reticulibacter mediterranei]|uniref:site-specific DNA-methyltransferase (adenine-specific) n=1 Tax=Reticulibacter mediterranei TaxID=2778369 RepID=A0A8J3N5D2_9CHLR|nr:type I restriction-modification system subunit M [Reticulibacter mediterranei]GHO96265.1 type I restriction-modification system subunit M [Reticulibacter mediterranei]